MLCSVVPCYQGLLHVVQCCYTWNRVVEFCAAVFYVVMCSCMLQCCYMLPRVITSCAVLLDVTNVITSVVRCYQELLHIVL